MAGGRPRKPTQLKVIQGTSRKCRENPAEPVHSPDRPETPEYLSTKAKKHFDLLVSRIEGRGYASADYTEIIALAALNFEHIKSRDFGIGNKARQAYRMCLVELGLTPSSASKVTVTKKKEEKQSKWAL